VKSKKPDTSPENCWHGVPPVFVFTTTTKFAPAGTLNEYEALGTVVPRPTTPLSPR
jgi:hypothetical protein